MGRREQRMPPCLYGAACTRKGCAYTHPKKHVVNEDVVCIPFLTGSCLFGNKCRNKHVSDQEKEEMLSKFASKPCRFGAKCRTYGCLYRHPTEEPKEDQPTVGQTFGLSEADMQARLARQEAQRKAYDDLIKQQSALSLSSSASSSSTSFPTPTTTTTFQHRNISAPAFSQGTDQFGQAFGVYQSSGFQADSFSSDSFSQEASTSRYQSFENVIPGYQMFETVNQKGASMPTPGYQMFESVRRMQQEEGNSMPTPAESAYQTYEPVSRMDAPLTMAERLKASAQVPAPAPSETQVAQQRQIVKIPQELWVDASRRNPRAFEIKDPLERYYQVSQTSPVGVIDLHFQTSLTVATVLDTVLPSSPFFESSDASSGYVWVVTGSGHHTTQRLRRLFDVVQEYLDHHGYVYKLGKDAQGHLGAFLVRVDR